jgi:two-component system, chemotaxis family, sensor kinase CheA
MKKIEEDILGWFNLTEYLWFSFGERYSVKVRIMAKNSVPASTIISNWSVDIQKLSSELGKKIDFFSDISDDINISKKLANMLNIELAHLYRNSVAHGIESIEERKKLGEFESGMISIRIKQASDQLNIVMEDDGKGLIEAKIKEKALANENLDQKQIQELIDANECWRILFLPGFSTADNITSLSGRGVGMDAVCTSIHKLNGEINMESIENKGITTRITIPL